VALIDVGGERLVADLLGVFAAFSPRGTYVATGDTDTFARVYDAGGGVRIARLGHGAAVTDVDFSPDERRLATASADGAGRVWAIRTGERQLILPSGSTTVHSARFSDDGRFVVTSGGDGVVRLWSSVNGRELLTLTGHRDAAVDATPSATGERIASASNDGTVRVWTTGIADQLQVVDRTRKPVERVGFARRGLAFAVARNGVYADGRLLRRGRRLVDGAAFGPHVAAISATGTGFLDGTALRVPRPGVALAVAPNGRRLVVAGGRIAKLVDVGSRRTIRTIRSAAPITALAFATDGGFALGSTRGRVELYGPGGARRAQLGDGSARVVAVAFSPDGGRVAWAARDGVAYVHSTRNGGLQHALPAHTALADLAFSPDGRYVATAAIGGDVRLWTAHDGRLIHILRGHKGLVARIAFSPDGRWLVSAGPTAAILWQVASGRQLPALRGHVAQLRDVAFSPDGREIVTGSDDGTARRYVCTVCGSVYDLARLAHARVVRIATLLTPQERRRYLGG
jgi:WD40 repeat protein